MLGCGCGYDCGCNCGCDCDCDCGCGCRAGGTEANGSDGAYEACTAIALARTHSPPIRARSSSSSCWYTSEKSTPAPRESAPATAPKSIKDAKHLQHVALAPPLALAIPRLDFSSPLLGLMFPLPDELDEAGAPTCHAALSLLLDVLRRPAPMIQVRCGAVGCGGLGCD